MNEKLQQAKEWWAGLNRKEQKLAKIGAVVLVIVLLAVIGNCSGN